MPELDDDRPIGALRTMAVPGHGDRFWAELGARLDALDAGDTGAGPRAVVAERAAVPLVVVPSTEPAPAPDRRLATGELPTIPREHARPPRHTGRWLAAAAAVLVIAVGAVALAGRGGDGGSQDLADAPGGDTTFSTAADGQLPATSLAPATTAANAPADTPEAAVATFLDALGSGDTEAAAAVLGPRTVRYLAAQLDVDPNTTDIARFLGSEVQEGYGAWAGVADRQLDTVLVGTADGGEAAVVLVSGTYEGEGMTDEDRVDAFAVVPGGDGWLVEWQGFDPATGGRPVFTAPAQTEDGFEPIGTGQLVEVFFPIDGTVAFLLDGQMVKVTPTSPVGANDDPYANLRVPDGTAEGVHHLVVAFFGEDATFATSLTLPVD